MMLKESLVGLEPQDPVVLGNLFLVPIRGRDSSVELDPLWEAIEEGKAEVRELGTAERVLVENPSLRDLFILEGEELLGARQDRIAPSSAVVSAGESLMVSVVCSEEGRWHGEGSSFHTGFIAHPRLRSIMTLSMKKENHVNQKEVWKEVKRKLTSLKVDSVTGSLHHSFSQRDGILEEIYGGWSPPEEIQGIMAFTPKGFLCADLLATHTLFSKEWPGLLKGYALDALEERWRGGGKGLSEKTMKEGWEGLSEASLGPCLGKRGKGREHLVNGEDYLGRALFMDGELLHLSFYPKG